MYLGEANVSRAGVLGPVVITALIYAYPAVSLSPMRLASRAQATLRREEDCFRTVSRPLDLSLLCGSKGRTCKRGTAQLARTRGTPRVKQSYTHHFLRTSHTQLIIAQSHTAHQPKVSLL